MVLTQSEPTDVLAIGNNPVLWILALSVMGIVILQSLIYMFSVKRNAESADMSQKEVNRAFRAGGIAALGPSVAVVIVAIALLPLFATPAVLTRVGLIGSAATEVASASLASETMGAQLGSEEYTVPVFIVALTAMSISGAGWMIAALVLTPIFKRSSEKLEQINPALMTIVPVAALLAAFAALTFREVPKSLTHVIAILASALTMFICLWIARRFNAAWLREWGLGFSVIIGLGAAYYAHYAGLGTVT